MNGGFGDFLRWVFGLEGTQATQIDEQMAKENTRPLGSVRDVKPEQSSHEREAAA